MYIYSSRSFLVYLFIRTAGVSYGRSVHVCSGTGAIGRRGFTGRDLRSVVDFENICSVITDATTTTTTTTISYVSATHMAQDMRAEVSVMICATGILTLLACTSIRSATGRFLINQGWTSICALLGLPSIGESVKDVWVCLSSDSFYSNIYSEQYRTLKSLFTIFISPLQSN